MSRPAHTFGHTYLGDLDVEVILLRLVNALPLFYLLDGDGLLDYFICRCITQVCTPGINKLNYCVIIKEIASGMAGICLRDAVLKGSATIVEKLPYVNRCEPCTVFC